MASIFRQAKSPYWYCQFRIPLEFSSETGKVLRWKQVKRCTKQTDRGKAERAALQMEQTAKASAGAGEEKSQELFRVVEKAAEVAAKGLLSEPLARQFVMQLYEISRGEVLESFTVRSWVEEWLRRKAMQVKPSTMSLYRLATGSFLECLGDRADSRLELVDRSDVRRFRDDVRRLGRTAKTTNIYKKTLFGLFKTAVQDGLLLHNPAAGVEDLPEDDSISREPFSLDEVRALCAAANDEWRVCILLGAYAGLRLRDGANLKWSCLDLQHGEMNIEPMKQARKKKTKKVLTIALHPSLSMAIKVLHTQEGEYVLPSLAERETKGRSGLSLEFGRIMQQAGVSRNEVRQKGENGCIRTMATRSFHSLRHTCISMLANAGVDQERRRKIVGHASESIHDIYTHFGREELRRSVEQMPSIL